MGTRWGHFCVSFGSQHPQLMASLATVLKPAPGTLPAAITWSALLGIWVLCYPQLPLLWFLPRAERLQHGGPLQARFARDELAVNFLHQSQRYQSLNVGFAKVFGICGATSDPT